MIEITLTFQGKHVDLLIPRQVTFTRLHRLIGDAFAEAGTRLPAGFTLAPSDKAITVTGSDVLTSFGVADGDRIRIETPKEPQHAD